MNRKTIINICQRIFQVFYDIIEQKLHRVVIITRLCKLGWDVILHSKHSILDAVISEKNTPFPHYQNKNDVESMAALISHAAWYFLQCFNCLWQTIFFDHVLFVIQKY